MLEWLPERHGIDFRPGDHSEFDPGVIEWNGLLLDGWKPLKPNQGPRRRKRPEGPPTGCASGTP